MDYREESDIVRRMRKPDGSLVRLFSRVHNPVKTHPGSDFNRFGERMETASMVRVGHVGNAVARLFRLKTHIKQQNQCVAKTTRHF